MAINKPVTQNYVLPYNIGPIDGLGEKFATLAKETSEHNSISIVSHGKAVHIQDGVSSLIRNNVVSGLPVADLPGNYFFMSITVRDDGYLSREQMAASQLFLAEAAIELLTGEEATREDLELYAKASARLMEASGITMAGAEAVTEDPRKTLARQIGGIDFLARLERLVSESPDDSKVQETPAEKAKPVGRVVSLQDVTEWLSRLAGTSIVMQRVSEDLLNENRAAALEHVRSLAHDPEVGEAARFVLQSWGEATAPRPLEMVRESSGYDEGEVGHDEVIAVLGELAVKNISAFFRTRAKILAMGERARPILERLAAGTNVEYSFYRKAAQTALELLDRS